jgi:hypothetical protein
MTVPQYLGLYLGRSPEQVSRQAMRGTYDQIHRTRERWQVVSMPRYPRIFRRSHRGRVFRFDPDRVTRQLAETNPLAAVAEWATPETVLEDRFLAAGLPARLSWTSRMHRVGMFLRAGEQAGYITDVADWQHPVTAIAPSAADAREMRISVATIRHYRLAHHLVALEAAMALRIADGTLPLVTRIEDDAALAAAARSHLTGRQRPGQTVSATPDLALRIGESRHAWVELLSDNYDGEDIAAKFAGLRMAVDFVATSSRVAARAAAGRPAMTCYHF